MFNDLDNDGDGTLSKEEFESMVSDKVLTTFLHTLDIDTYDMSMLFQIYDEGDGQFSIQQFIDGLTHVKGPAKSIDLLKVMVSMWHLTQKMEDVQTLVRESHLPDHQHMTHTLFHSVKATNSKLDMLLCTLQKETDEGNMVRKDSDASSSWEL